ncbi:MAG: hypothetical protein HQL47_00960 [Gammaproteobacteria bacterium]|nr:hypothetical protein [Gammaproteobacteria bacterium]
MHRSILVSLNIIFMLFLCCNAFAAECLVAEYDKQTRPEVANRIGIDGSDHVHCGKEDRDSEYLKVYNTQRSARFFGIIGVSTVDVTLDFLHDRAVMGRYRVRKTGKEYELKGRNYQEGRIKLSEYADGDHTGEILLSNGYYNNRKAWVGKIYNLDGNVYNVVFFDQ